MQPKGSFVLGHSSGRWPATSLVCRTQRRRVQVAAAGTTGSKSAKKLLKGVNPDTKEAHRIFDEAFITVKSGDGGQGEIVQKGRGRWVPNNKYQPGSQQPKRIWLPASEPGDGSDGADVVLVVDPSLDNLLHLHARKQYTAPKGANSNPAVGSGGPKANRDIKKQPTPPFEIPVPPGTVVKRKSNGMLLGDLTNKGDRLVVAYGGRGGMGVVAPSRSQKLANMSKQFRRAQATNTEVLEVQDTNWKLDSMGGPGQQLSLHLLLRVVADVGIVGLPNAGKSSLLKALTKASPGVAPYPFTTLMPNLGVLASGGPSRTVLADLPGLIEGAHTGRGLGRMFLRHLRRTRMIMHVVDCSVEDPATDYYVVREELRMYNPEYCARPHVVVLNKFDLQPSTESCDKVIADLLAVSEQHCKEFAGEDLKPTPPTAVVLCSAATGEGVGELNKALADALAPGRLQQVQAGGASATEVLRPATPSIGTAAAAAAAGVGAGAAVSAHQGADEEALLAMDGDNWSASAVDDDEDDAPEKADPEDAWMLELSDKQLLKLLEQDEARCAAKEAAATAQGYNPYEGEGTSPDGSVSMPIGARMLAQSQQQQQQQQEEEEGSSSWSRNGWDDEGDGWQGTSSRGGGEPLPSQRQQHQEVESFALDEDFSEEELDLDNLEGLEGELSQEDLELLQFLREQEAAGLVEDDDQEGSRSSRSSSSEGKGSSNSSSSDMNSGSNDSSSSSGGHGGSSEAQLGFRSRDGKGMEEKNEEEKLMGLSEQQLLELADKGA